ncbi:MAG: ACT domain-containing protein [Spirochaetaceae bacterium]
MKLEIIKKSCTLYRLDENREVPREIYQSSFFSVTKTDQELSIICDSDVSLSCCGIKEKELRLIRVVGFLGFNTTGIISSISDVLTKNDISFFAISTFETDYIMVQTCVFDRTVEALSVSGFDIK